MKAAAFVLAGGRSSRMGRDKALLPLRSGLLIQTIAAKAAAAAGTAVLIGDPDRYGRLGIECLPDLRPGMGPLAGIETALASGRGELNLVLACDMPDIETRWLRRLLAGARQTDQRCIVTREPDGALQPLCAVYRSHCLGLVEAALDEGRLKLLELVRELKACALQIDTTISNINTPQEWAAWQRAERA